MPVNFTVSGVRSTPPPAELQHLRDALGPDGWSARVLTGWEPHLPWGRTEAAHSTPKGELDTTRWHLGLFPPTGRRLPCLA